MVESIELCETAYIDATYALHTAWNPVQSDMWADRSDYAEWAARLDALIAQRQCDRGERSAVVSSTHRVMCQCPKCGAELSAGRLHQHIDSRRCVLRTLGIGR